MTYARIRPLMLRTSQLPDQVTDGIRTYRMPAKWAQSPTRSVRTDVLLAPCPEAGCQKTIGTCRWR